MAKKKYEIPRCPECNKEIKAVNEIVYERYDFNEKSGRYINREPLYGGDMEIKCNNCGADISDIFEEGVCNYQA